MKPFENSLNPAREDGEAFEDYQDRRKRLNVMGKLAGKKGRVVYDPKKIQKGVREKVTKS